MERTINLYGKEIKVRKYGCKNHKRDLPLWIEVPRINLFIQTTNLCNANCPFCIYHSNEKKEFNIEKLGEIVKTISSRKDLEIGKLNFTGGEPTLINLNEIIKTCKENLDLERKPEITLNTNGLSLKEIVEHQDFLDSVGLSRHHYNDKVNEEIFRTESVANSKAIKEMMNNLEKKEIIQLRCNLIKGYIDNYSEMTKYMDEAMKLGINDCGFVTLTPNNEYCRNHQIDFANLVKINRNIIKVNSWNRLNDNDFSEIYCECANYIYSNNEGNMCKFYSRLFCRNDNTDGILVYDGQYLRHGFGGEIIY